MNKILLASLAGVAVAASTPAQAHPTYHYEGGCFFFTISDGTESSQTTWEGEIHAAAIATDAYTHVPEPVSIEVECVLVINRVMPGRIVFRCTTPGISSVGCAAPFSFTAHPMDTVEMCDQVTVRRDSHLQC